MFTKKIVNIEGREAILVEGVGRYSLEDTFECGQCFRYMKLSPNERGERCSIGKKYENYIEYMTVVGEHLIFVGQRNTDELIFFGMDEKTFDALCPRYFALCDDYEMIKNDILGRTDSEFLRAAAECASGIRILRQDPWETLFSFIISQNNNIPRIRGIIRNICASYGTNLALSSGLCSCPLECCGDLAGGIDREKCKSCGICYTFPSAIDVLTEPEKLNASRPGFRYKYLVDAALRVSNGDVNLGNIAKKNSYDFTLSELQKIKGVGEKVASCTSLFAFSNLEAFPIDVWMRRAIDEYFDGNLDPATLGAYAGVAQQYIFHYIRNL